MSTEEIAERRPELESIFIPYGSIIFACHKVNNQASKNGNGYPQYYEQHTGYNLPPMAGPAYPGSEYNSQRTSSAYPTQNYGSPVDSGSLPSYHQWTSQNTPMSSSPTVSSMRSSSYAPQQPPTPQHQWSSHPPAFMESSGGSPYSSFSSSAPYAPPPAASTPTSANTNTSTNANEGSPPPSDDVVPASRNGHRRNSGANRDLWGSLGRGTGNPPIGIMQCVSCKATQSPEWRKGPSGKKDLCNACGLRYARSRAKKEGGTQRRRKEKALNTMSSRPDHSPSASPVNVPYNGMRRGSTYEDSGSFSAGSSSMPLPAGGESYSSQPAGMNGQSSPTSDHSGHAQYPPTFYSIPPPMPGSSHGIQGGSHASATLPRIDPMMMPPFNGRMSPPMHSPTTPGTASSPLNSHFPPPSYEREKQRENERGILSSAPISAERKY